LNAPESSWKKREVWVEGDGTLWYESFSAREAICLFDGAPLVVLEVDILEPRESLIFCISPPSPPESFSQLPSNASVYPGFGEQQPEAVETTTSALAPEAVSDQGLAPRGAAPELGITNSLDSSATEASEIAHTHNYGLNDAWCSELWKPMFFKAPDAETLEAFLQVREGQVDDAESFFIAVSQDSADNEFGATETYGHGEHLASYHESFRRASAEMGTIHYERRRAKQGTSAWFSSAGKTLPSVVQASEDQIARPAFAQPGHHQRVVTAAEDAILGTRDRGPGLLRRGEEEEEGLKEFSLEPVEEQNQGTGQQEVEGTEQQE